jgi:prepilin-type N-terminal cleavage/methylation domain-containing protein
VNRHRFTHNEGFTLIEIMISIGLISIATVGLSAVFISQLKAQKGMELQGRGRTILDSIILSAQKDPSRFFHIRNGGKPSYYVGCFDEKGIQVPDAKFKKDDYVVLQLANANDFSTRALLNGAPVCTSRFEVHILPDRIKNFVTRDVMKFAFFAHTLVTGEAMSAAKFIQAEVYVAY